MILIWDIVVEYSADLIDEYCADLIDEYCADRFVGFILADYFFAPIDESPAIVVRNPATQPAPRQYAPLAVCSVK